MCPALLFGSFKQEHRLCYPGEWLEHSLHWYINSGQQISCMSSLAPNGDILSLQKWVPAYNLKGISGQLFISATKWTGSYLLFTTQIVSCRKWQSSLLHGLAAILSWSRQTPNKLHYLRGAGVLVSFPEQHQWMVEDRIVLGLGWLLGIRPWQIKILLTMIPYIPQNKLIRVDSTSHYYFPFLWYYRFVLFFFSEKKAIFSLFGLPFPSHLLSLFPQTSCLTLF